MKLKSNIDPNSEAFAKNAAHHRAPSSPSMGEVSPKATEGVRALTVQTKPLEAQPETSAGLTPSVTLRVTAPPSRGSGGCGEVSA